MELLTINEPMFYYENIINSFKKGEFFSKEHLEKINIIFNPLAKDNYIKTYKDKTRLLSSRNYKIYDGIIYVRGKGITREDYVYIIRAFNLTYKGSRIIVINNDIVYIPDFYKNLGRNYLREEISRIIRNNRREYFLNILKSRNKIKYIFALFTALFNTGYKKKFEY